ncbi:HAD family hydrolase [soil metagenome]
MPAVNYGVIWDVDGTLVDTAELHFEAWRRTCQELGRDFTRADFAATFGRRNPEIMTELFGNRFTATEVDEIAIRKEDYYRDAVRIDGVALLPGVAVLLKGLQEAGFRQAVGSSAPRLNVDLILQLTNTGDYFAGISACEDAERGKPDPQVFLIAAKHMDIAPENCLVFEDAVAGIQAARNGGMRSVAITFVGHHPAEKLQAAGADRIVATLEEVTVADVKRLLAAE